MRYPNPPFPGKLGLKWICLIQDLFIIFVIFEEKLNSEKKYSEIKKKHRNVYKNKSLSCNWRLINS
jgi:hypothetical protein